jgi:hypothetical protein
MATKSRTVQARSRRPSGSAKRIPKHLKKPELRWMDRFLRSLHQVAPVESIPAIYLQMLRNSTKGIPRTLH